jgi:hypothetical protein
VTKNQDLKRRAREYRKSHPDIRLADAMRAVAPPDTSDRATWSVGGTPWIRRAEVPSSCFFCGQDTIIRSMTDMATDNGRVEIYCDTGDCDAREVEVIVVEDGTTATRSRTDVRIMRHIAPANPHILWTGPGSAWAAGTAPALRMRTGWMTCVFCGETTRDGLGCTATIVVARCRKLRYCLCVTVTATKQNARTSKLFGAFSFHVPTSWPPTSPLDSRPSSLYPTGRCRPTAWTRCRCGSLGSFPGRSKRRRVAKLRASRIARFGWLSRRPVTGDAPMPSWPRSIDSVATITARVKDGVRQG